MKILKTLGKVVLIVLIIGAVISIFMPSVRHIERSIEISKEPALVFKQVNNIKNWKNWSYWDNIDPKMISKYEGPDEGIGAKHSWTSDHELVGVGSMTFTASEAPSHVGMELEFGGMVTPGGWNFEQTDSGTKATVYMDMQLPFYGRIFPGVMMDSWLGADFEKTLANLKKWSESQADSEAPAWNVEVIDFSAVEMMSTQVVCKPSEIGLKLGESYGAIGAAMGKQGLKQTGPVFAVYLSYSEDSVVMQPAIPVEKQGKNEGAVTAGTLAATKAVRLDYYGDYPGTEQAHYFIDEWVKSKNMTIIGPPWEEYVTDPMAEKDTSKWLTRIYYPVQ